MVEYSLDLQNINLSAIRTVRVLRPLKAINRVPSELDLSAHTSLPAQLALFIFSEKIDQFLAGPDLCSRCWTDVTLFPLNSWASMWYPESAGEGDLMPLSSQITWISALGKSDCSGRKGYLGVVHTDCQRGLLRKKKVISLRENEFMLHWEAGHGRLRT